MRRVYAFVQALRLLEDAAEYEKYSRLALENSQRPELGAQFQVDRFIEYVERHLSSTTSPASPKPTEEAQ
jgi:hypothetical protein